MLFRSVKRTRDGWKAEPKFGRIRDGNLATGKGKESTECGTKETSSCRTKTILNVPTFLKPAQDCNVMSAGTGCASEQNVDTSVNAFQESIETCNVLSRTEHIHSVDATTSGIDSKPSTR